MKTMVNTVAVLVVSAFVVAMWRDAGGAAQSVTDVVGWAAGLVQEAVGHLSEFVQQL
jgi:hypothetical protein